MKKLLFIILLSTLTFTRCNDIIENIMPTLTQVEVTEGLKEALKIGSKNAVDIVGIADGFFKNPEIKIPLPEQAKVLTDLLNNSEIPTFLLTPLSDGISQVEEKLNRAAENASKEAVEVFVVAITQMTVVDAISILKGSDDAATQYLKKTTSGILQEKFSPIVDSAVENIQLAQYWETLANTYNTIVSTGIIQGEQVDVNLNEYVTNKTLDGLFVMVAKEELKIRTDPNARINDILKKVFGSNLNPYNN
jgi:hypothetical protein